MPARPDLPDWIGEGDGPEGIAPSHTGQAAHEQSEFDNCPSAQPKSRCKRLCICSFVLLSLFGLAIGLTIGITKKNPQQLFSGAKGLLVGGGGRKKGNAKNVKVMEITSPGFDDGGPCPVKYTADGDNISPPLTWSTPPKGTESLVVIMDDPQAQGGAGFTHWLVLNIPPDTTELIEAIPPSAYVTNDMKEDTALAQGVNDEKIAGYMGPDPPAGSGDHTYYFHIYAFDVPVELDTSKVAATRKSLKNAVKEITELGHGQVTCTYGRE